MNQMANDEVDVETVERENRRMELISDKKLSSSILSEQTVLRISSAFIDSGLVDDDDIAIVNESLSVFAYRQLSASLWKVSVSCVLLALISYTLMCGMFLNLTSLTKCAISVGLSLALYSVWNHLCASVLIECVVNYYIRSANRFDEAVQQLFSMLHFVDISTFGLIPNRQYLMKQRRLCMRALRIDFLETLREAVSKQQHASDAICSADEKEYLLWASLTPEMAALTSAKKRKEEFLSLASLKELWQFYFMLRSEFIRLFLLNMFEWSASNMFSSLIGLYRYAKIMNGYSSKMIKARRIIDRQSMSCVEDDGEENVEKRDKQMTTLLTGLGSIDRACVRLGVAYDLLSSSKNAVSSDKDDTVNGVVGILKEVIKSLTDAKRIEDSQAENADALKGNQREDSPSRQTGGIQEAGMNRAVLGANAPSPVTVDQMFEAVSYMDESHENYTTFETDVVDENVKASTKSVINELQCVLLDRKRVMRKRERIALKRFYEQKALDFGETNKQSGNVDNDEMDPDWYSRNFDSSETEDDDSISELETASKIANHSDQEQDIYNNRMDSDDGDEQFERLDGNSSNSDRQESLAGCRPDTNFNSSKAATSVFGASFGEALRRRAVEPQQTFGDSDSDSMDSEGRGDDHSHKQS